MATDSEAVPVDLGVSDTELFQDAFADETASEPAAEATTEATGEDAPNRDEQGRFAKTEEAEAKSDPEPKVETPVQDDDKDAQVPSWRVREINAEKAELAKNLEAERAERSRLTTQFEAMQREVQSLRKPVEQPEQPDIPDPLVDPNGYRQHIRREMQESILNERRESSYALAHRTYKQDFDEAYSSAREAIGRGDAGLTARLNQARDPGESLMAWHREQKTMREVGNDPNAFFEKRLETYLSDPANMAKVMERARGGAQSVNGQTQRPNVQLPPSLSNMSRAEGSRGGDDDSDLSDEALFKYATR